jgi:hypothetical protein
MVAQGHFRSIPAGRTMSGYPSILLQKSVAGFFGQ